MRPDSGLLEHHDRQRRWHTLVVASQKAWSSGRFHPFNYRLSTLNSFTIAWNTTHSSNGVVDVASDGSFTAQLRLVGWNRAAASFNGPWDIAAEALGDLHHLVYTGKRSRRITPGWVMSFIGSFSSFPPFAAAIEPATGHLYVALRKLRKL